MTMPAQTVVWHCEHCGSEVEGDFQAMRWTHRRNGCGKLIREPIPITTIHPGRRVPSPLSDIDLVEVLTVGRAQLLAELDELSKDFTEFMRVYFDDYYVKGDFPEIDRLCQKYGLVG